ncbi:MAG: hypothetical protein ACOCW9_04895, partial [Thermodesulfobacteriota bacterium]
MAGGPGVDAHPAGGAAYARGIVTPETLNPNDYDHFQRLQLELDLPPFTYAVYLPPGPADK